MLDFTSLFAGYRLANFNFSKTEISGGVSMHVYTCSISPSPQYSKRHVI